jgi:hypothetical protein
MYNGKKIVMGLVIFVLLVTSPILANVGRDNAEPDISTDTPAIAQMTDKQCIESKEYMLANHMQMLNEWRDKAVRNGQTVYISDSGTEYEVSLENECLRCHSNKVQFCDSCHTYTEVEPYCWDCHNGSKGADL